MCMLFPLQASAQWSFGASYEMREQAPENGFGVRLERDLLGNLPLVDVGLRAHFSFFNEENEFNQGDVVFAGDFTIYDYGLAATGGVSVGLLKPYIGLGIGRSNVEFEGTNFEDSESNTFWNGFVGAELTPIPKLNPFIEYRFQPTDEAEFAPSSDGRLIIGLLLSF